jgi:multidrug efflux pump subunit AcrA (membrane-fusion protein)
VPQSYSSQIRPGSTATLTVPELPGRQFAATLTTTANSISDNSGTLLVELLVNNDNDLLKDGDYAQVSFALQGQGVSAAAPSLELPSSALLFRRNGTQVALVGPDNHVHLKSITIGRDLGTTIEVTSGVSASDKVIDNPPDSITDGQLVRVVQGGANSATGAHNGDA